MSNEKTRKVLEDNAKPGVTDPLINKQNLALLHKRDRTVIMGVGLVMSMAGTTIVTPGSDNSQAIVVFAGTTVFAVIALLVLVYVRASRYSGLEVRLNSENAAARIIG
jgi:hypothetical protein